MYPGPGDPDLGVFVRQMESALRERGHEIDLAVVDRRGGGKRRYMELARRVRRAPKPNVVRLADAFARLREGSLTFVGDGPLRSRLDGREGVQVVGRVPHDEVPGWMASADVVCQPSLIEPLGQSLLEAMACGRSVVATRIGGPPEFVPEDAGVLVDPTDLDDLERGLRAAAALPRPNDAARAAAAEHDVRRQAQRIEELLERAASDRRA